MSRYEKDLIRIGHMLDMFDELASYQQMDRGNIIRIRASERNLEIMGEASKHISDELKDRFSDIPWKEIKGYRNRLTHEYFDCEIDILWEIIDHELPELREKLITMRDWMEAHND